MRRCLRRSGVIGQAIPSSVIVRQRGRIRSSTESKWLGFVAKETYGIADPWFEWKASLRIAGITVGRATDTLRNGAGNMHVKLLGLMSVVDASGPEIDQGSALRWLNETMWFPAVWATNLISWREVDANTAIGYLTISDRQVHGEFRFDNEGRLVDFRADRYRTVGSDYEMTPWSTPLTRHDAFHGIELPCQGSGVWILEDSVFEYIQIELVDVHYD